MEKRLKNYIQKTEALTSQVTAQNKERILKDLLIQIGFFQHERLIHLIVTALFALLTVGGITLCLLMPEITSFALTFLLLALLIPYIRHYYILENGVQHLYELYDIIQNQS